MNKEAYKKMREIAIFRNMVKISEDNGQKTFLHHDDMLQYNSWFLTCYHYVDKVVYRGDSKNLPSEYKSFLESIGNPERVIVTKSTQDTY